MVALLMDEKRHWSTRSCLENGSEHRYGNEKWFCWIIIISYSNYVTIDHSAEGQEAPRVSLIARAPQTEYPTLHEIKREEA